MTEHAVLMKPGRKLAIREEKIGKNTMKRYFFDGKKYFFYTYEISSDRVLSEMQLVRDLSEVLAKYDWR